MVAGFVVIVVLAVPAVVETVVFGALVVDDSHSTLVAQSQYLNFELKSNPLGQFLT